MRQIIRFPANANDAISLVAVDQADIGLYYQQDIESKPRGCTGNSACKPE